jgi:hypothetical protein
MKIEIYSSYPGIPFWKGTLAKVIDPIYGYTSYSLEPGSTAIPSGSPIVLHLEIPECLDVFYIESIDFLGS